MAWKYRATHRSRFNRLLSKGRIFGRKSKRAQASQIYALKKKLFSYIRRTRPETVIQQHTSETSLLNTADTAANGGEIGVLQWNYIRQDDTALVSPRLVPMLSYSTDIESKREQLQNQFARLYNVHLEGVFRYWDNADTVAPIALRLVVVQLVKSRQTEVQVNDIFRQTMDTVTVSDSNAGNAIAVYGPLQTGVTSIGRILRDVRYTLQPGRTSAIKIDLNLRRLTNFRYDTQGLAYGQSEAVAQGTIYVFYAVSRASTDSGTANCSLILNAKLAFPDN